MRTTVCVSSLPQWHFRLNRPAIAPERALLGATPANRHPVTQTTFASHPVKSAGLQRSFPKCNTPSSFQSPLRPFSKEFLPSRASRIFSPTPFRSRILRAMASNSGSKTVESAVTSAGVFNEDGSARKKFPESGYLSLQPYDPPEWASHLKPLPSQFLTLAHRPTPIHRWDIPDLPTGTELYIKRDDLSGMELSGNKVRKLEFLLADALAKGADTLITIGGIQSNHCRATAVAARLAGLEAHLILRTSRALADSDPGLEGNLLVERMVGARVHLVTKEEYAKHGSEHLGKVLAARLSAEGRKPYVIPVGGSNALGTWGYVEAVREIEQQLRRGEGGGAPGFDDIAMACGSGGTSAGLALGVHLSTLASRVHAYSVCDNPGYFYDYIQGLLDGVTSKPGSVVSRDLLRVVDVKGAGYAMSTEEELQLVQSVAQSTGIVLDPVYSGKALRGLLQEMRQNPGEWAARRVLFVHTGGLLGMYDKVQQLLPMVGGWERMAVE